MTALANSRYMLSPCGLLLLLYNILHYFNKLNIFSHNLCQNASLIEKKTEKVEEITISKQRKNKETHEMWGNV